MKAESTKELLEYAINAYGFVIPRGETISNLQFVGFIMESYSFDTPRELAVRNAIELNPNITYSKHFNSVVSFSGKIDVIVISA